MASKKHLRIKQKNKQSVNVRVHIDNRRGYSKKSKSKSTSQQIRSQTIFMTTPANNPPPIINYSYPNPFQSITTPPVVSKSVSMPIPTPDIVREANKTPDVKIPSSKFMEELKNTLVKRNDAKRDALLEEETDADENILSRYMQSRNESVINKKDETNYSESNDDMPIIEKGQKEGYIINPNNGREIQDNSTNRKNIMTQWYKKRQEGI